MPNKNETWSEKIIAQRVAKVPISRSVIPFNLVFPGKFLFWNEVFVAFISEVNLF